MHSTQGTAATPTCNDSLATGATAVATTTSQSGDNQAATHAEIGVATDISAGNALNASTGAHTDDTDVHEATTEDNTDTRPSADQAEEAFASATSLWKQLQHATEIVLGTQLTDAGGYLEAFHFNFQSQQQEDLRRDSGAIGHLFGLDAFRWRSAAQCVHSTYGS